MTYIGYYLSKRQFDCLSESLQDSKGLMATLSTVGSVNTDVFLFYIQERLIPQSYTEALIDMDNLSVH